MGEIDKMDAFSLVVKYMEAGNEATAKRLLHIIVRAMQQEKEIAKRPSSIRIVNDEDAKMFRDLYLKAAE